MICPFGRRPEGVNTFAFIYLDLLAKPFMPDDEKYSYYFYDMNAKINHKFSDRSRMFLSAYHGQDHFAADYDGNTDFKDGSNMGWGNTIVSARGNYIFKMCIRDRAYLLCKVLQ